MQMKRLLPRKESIWFTKEHAAKKIREKAADEVLLEETKKGLMKKEGPGSAIAAKETPMEGTITEFKKLFADAIIYGYQRDATLGTADADIRSAVRKQEFINTVADAPADSPFATPIEGEDVRYAKDMRKVRADLGKKLASGNVGSLSNNELDVVLSIILASSSVDGSPLAPQAYNAFFDFLENAAQHSAPGKEGAFMANVLLALTSRNTMDEELKLNTLRQIADVTLIDRTLSQKADPMLEKAVALFKNALDHELATPTTTLNPELEVPGMGYYYRKGIGAAMAERTEAITALAEANAAYQAAVAACSTDANEANAKAVQTTSAARNAATTRVNNASDAVVKIVPEIGNKSEQDAMPIIQVLISHEQEMPRISRKFEDAFRLAFIECRRNGMGLDDKSEKPDDAIGLDKLGDNGHPSVMALVNQAKDVAAFIAEHGQAKAAARIAALETSTSGAQLPKAIKEEMAVVIAQMKEAQGYNKDPTEKEIADIEKRYGYPVKKAAICAMKNYAQMRTGTIPDAQWITARVRFQGDAIPKSMPLKRDRFRGIRNDLQRIIHLQLPDAWYMRYPIQAMGIVIPYYPVKWFAKATLRNDNLKEGIRNQKSTYIDKNGNRQQSKWKRKHTGLFQAGSAILLAADMVISLVSSVNYSVKHNYGLWDGFKKGVEGAASWYYRLPPAQLSVAPGTALRNPMTWWNPQLGDKDTLKSYEDDVNIPERLATRPDGYYKGAFGVGNDSTQETGKRLDWLRGRQGVLQFLQERTSGVHVNDWKILPKNPATTLKFDTTTVEGGQVKGARVWRILRMDTTRIADGLVLNRANTDAFVDTLRAMEARKANGSGFMGIGTKKLDYAFMQTQANKMAWEDYGFLVPKERLDLMEALRIKDGSNALFVTLQPGVRAMLEPRSKLGVSSEYIEKPDDFVLLWRNNVMKICGSDPATVPVPQSAIQQAFEATRTALWKTNIRDASAEFEEAQIMRQVGTLHLGDATMAMLSANKDVRGLLMQFGGTSGYSLNPNRIDDFVQRLASYKQKGGNINDFSPFMHGARVGWAMGQGYFAAKQFTMQETTEASEAAAVHVQPHAGTLSAGAKAFYAGTGAAKVNAILAGMGANEGAKERVYEMLIGTSPRAEAAKRLAGITVSGEGAGMAVTMGDIPQAKKWLAAYARR